MAPERLLSRGRHAGVCLHLTALPGAYGIGEIGGTARRFIDTMKKMQLGVWQFLPTGPTAFGDSPYQPLSTFAGNEMLIDVQELIDEQLLEKNDALPLTTLPAASVDYGSLVPVKSRLLMSAARQFRRSAGPALNSAFEEFVRQHDRRWLHDYALYRILKEVHDSRAWPEWAPEFVHRDPQALRRIETAESEQLADIKVLQFLFFRQWQQLRRHAHDNGIRLFGDMPIYIALDSADAWAHPDMLRIDRDGRPQVVAGVPPDYFSADGQLWGNPVYDWEVHARSQFRWWTQRLGAAIDLADLVRIDHFRGFEAYWAVPAGSTTARTGSWEPGPGDAIFEAMRGALGSLPVVAEDLGVITPAVEALRDRHGLPGMVVLQFAIGDEKFRLSDVPENCVCYTGTHDNDTTVGWFNGGPGDTRDAEEILATREAALRVSGGAPATIHTDMIRAAFATRAFLAMVPLQDYLGLGSEARFNVPGTSVNNWRWRATAAQLADDFCGHVAGLVRDAGRALSD